MRQQGVLVNTLTRLSALACCMLAIGCQPSKPPPNYLPTKENTVDKVKNDVEKAMREAQEKRDAEDPAKKGY
jgi:hypothetical protein